MVKILPLENDDSIEALFEKAEQRIEYAVEGATIELTEEIVREMEKQGISRADLAQKLGAKASYITRILKGNHNFTLRKMVEVARALGCELRLHLQPDGADTCWHDYFATRVAVDASVVALQATPANVVEFDPGAKQYERSSSVTVPSALL